MNKLTRPYGGRLTSLIIGKKEVTKLKNKIYKLPSWNLTQRQLYDLELIMNGGFSPLEGFMRKKDYDSVIGDMRLSNNLIWPIPIVLDIDKDFAINLYKESQLVVRDGEGIPLAIINIEDIWVPNKETEAKKVYGSTNRNHAGVRYLLEKTNPVYVGGKILGLELPSHHSFNDIRHTPKELRSVFKKRGWSKIVAFQTRNPIHKVHYELTMRAAKESKAKLLIHPVVGPTKPGDLNYYIRVRCYKAAFKYYPRPRTQLSLLPLSMRIAGPREAIWHAIIRRNYGCSHFIVGRDHAGPGKDKDGNNFYGEYDAQKLLTQYESDIGIKAVPFEELYYVAKLKKYLPKSVVPPKANAKAISGSMLRNHLYGGKRVPEWLSFKEVVDELRKVYPDRNRQGFTVFFSGLSGSGKSTIAKLLLSKLLEMGSRPATLLDGDIVRQHLSSELGFSKKHRDLNIRRIGFVASEITKNRGIAICAPIAPYNAVRKEVREMISQYGGFMLVYVSTPIKVCEKRDRKGLYAKARAGLIKEFTGIDDPYEPPNDADIVIDTTNVSPKQAAEQIISWLEKKNYIK
jgi:sulfate adenylyltransferase